MLQARTLEWGAISFSSAWKWSRLVVSDSLRPHELQPTRLLCPWVFPGKSTGVGCYCLLRSYIYIYTQNYFTPSYKKDIYDGSIFSFLRHLHIVLHSGSINLLIHSYQQCKKFPFSLHPLQYLLFVDFLMAIPTGVKCRLLIILLCISLMISDGEHLFMCLLVTCMPSLAQDAHLSALWWPRWVRWGAGKSRREGIYVYV